MFHSEKIVAQQYYQQYTRSSHVRHRRHRRHRRRRGAAAAAQPLELPQCGVVVYSSTAAVSSVLCTSTPVERYRTGTGHSKNYVLQCAAFARRAARWRQGAAAALRGAAHRWRAARAQICAELIELYRLLLLQLSDRFRCVRMHRDNFFLFFPK